jgi:hypothetical protein
VPGVPEIFSHPEHLTSAVPAQPLHCLERHTLLVIRSQSSPKRPGKAAEQEHYHNKDCGPEPWTANSVPASASGLETATRRLSRLYVFEGFHFADTMRKSLQNNEMAAQHA